MLNIQAAAIYLNEKFSLTVQHADSIYNNSVLEILLQLTFTVSAVSEKTAEWIIMILKAFITLYARVYNKKNLLKESNNAVKDKKDGF